MQAACHARYASQERDIETLHTSAAMSARAQESVSITKSTPTIDIAQIIPTESSTYNELTTIAPSSTPDVPQYQVSQHEENEEDKSEPPQTSYTKNKILPEVHLSEDGLNRN